MRADLLKNSSLLVRCAADEGFFISLLAAFGGRENPGSVTVSSTYDFIRDVTRLDDLLRRQSLLDPDATLLRLPTGTVTYEAVEEKAKEFARLLLDLGVEHGDRVAILAENGVGFVAAFYGAMRAGAIAVPVNTAVDGRGLAHVLRDSGARVLMMTKRFLRATESAMEDGDATSGVQFVIGENALAGGKAEHVVWLPDEPARGSRYAGPPGLEPFGHAELDDVATIIYTSGSTGAPRGATLTHRNVLTNTWSILEYLRLSEEDRMLVILPFYYVYGMSLLNTHVAVGGALIVGTELFFPNKVVDRMHAEKATGFAGVPSSFNVLLHRSRFPQDVPPSLQYVTQAGGAMAPELTRELIDALPAADIFVMYGATEASARLSYVPPHKLKHKLGSIGIAIPGVTLRVLREDGMEADVDDPGELVASGDNIMRGYWGAPEETAEVLGPDGLRTGDLARRDADGYFYIVGRKKEMIKSGAHRISPKEIEERLVEHPAVLEAAVIGVPDELLGEAIVAFVVLHTNVGGGELPDERAIQRFLMDRVAEYKVPRRVLFRESLPKNESGKIQKRELKTDVDSSEDAS